jgi:hypothetical protein
VTPWKVASAERGRRGCRDDWSQADTIWVKAPRRTCRAAQTRGVVPPEGLGSPAATEVPAT